MAYARHHRRQSSDEMSTYDRILNDDNVDLARIKSDYMLVLLRTAVAENDTPLVRKIYQRQPELLTIDEGGGGVTLWRALRNENSTEIATMLVRAGVDLTQRHPVNNSTFLHWLVQRVGDVKGAEQLIELMIEYGADVNAKDVMGKRILPMAIEIHAKNVVEALLKYDADVEDDDISRAAFGYRTAEMLPMLLAAAADVETRKRRARTALWCYLCCQPLEEFTSEIFHADKPSNYHKDFSLIRRIVQYALLPKPSDIDVIHVLIPAVRLGHYETVRIILEYNVDFHKEPQYAAQLFCFASRLDKSSIARLLIERGANIDDPNDLDEPIRRYPLHEACKNNSIQNIHLLLRLGADINVLDRNGQTPFSLLSSDSFTHHHQLFIKRIAILVSKGAVVNENDLNSIRDHPRMQIYYEDCMNELHKMRGTWICDDLTFFCFFDKTLPELTAYVGRADFIDKYRTSRRERRTLFPLYHTQMDNVFEIAERRRNFLIIRQKFFDDSASSANDDLPNDLEYVERDFYFMLHDRIDRGEPGYDINLLR